MRATNYMFKVEIYIIHINRGEKSSILNTRSVQNIRELFELRDPS